MQHEKFLLNYAVVPPSTLFFYMPLSVLNIHFSKFLFNLISVLVFCYFLYRLLVFLNISSGWILLLPVLVLLPFRNNLLFGQGYLLLTGLMMGGFISESKNKNLPAAIYYSIAIVLKISPAILLIYLLVRKKNRLFLLTLLISTALFFAAVSITGWQLMNDYLFRSLPRMMQNEINNPYASNYQSVTVLLRNLFVPDRLLNPNALFNAPLVFSIAGGICTGILFFLLIRKLKSLENDFSAFAFILFGSLVLTAYTSSYSLVFLIPFCIYIINQRPKAFILYLILLLAIAWIPVNMFQSVPVAFHFPRLYLILILYLITTANRKIIFREVKWLIASMIFFTSSSIAMLKKNNDKSEYVLSQDAGLLSYDFQISGNNLLLKTLYEDGGREKEYVMNDSAATIEPLKIIDGQIFFNGPVTNGNDNKLNPVLVNGKEIIYLSDKNRGIGFYTLRKIKIPQVSGNKTL
jgi:hypothetical protein